jgi:hypothetical protein
METLTTFMAGEDSRWQLRLPDASGSNETSESDDIPLEELRALENAEDAVSSERRADGEGWEESRGTRGSMTSAAV